MRAVRSTVTVGGCGWAFVLMQPEDLHFPVIYHRRQIYFLERAETNSRSYVGGPSGARIGGVEHGPRRLHHIATIATDCFEPLTRFSKGEPLRILYGLCYDGCTMEYRDSGRQIEILRIEPSCSRVDWPYPDYPSYLPFFPLKLQRRVVATWDEFSQLSVQPLEQVKEEAIILIPSSPIWGMSLWGPWADGEGVQIVLKCDLTARTVIAHNQCG